MNIIFVPLRPGSRGKWLVGLWEVLGSSPNRDKKEKNNNEHYFVVPKWPCSRLIKLKRIIWWVKTLH